MRFGIPVFRHPGRAFVCMVSAAAVQVCSPDVTIDRKPWWDSDGDTISTAVEIESHNRQRYGFDTTRFDFNPSIASGTRSNGFLIRGLNLPDTGFGYIHDPGTDFKDSDDWGTLALINTVEQAGREFRRKPCQTLYADPDHLPRQQTLDMSLDGGQYFYPHDEHQNGLDVDVRYMRTNGEGQLDLADPTQAPYFDLTGTLELMSCFLQTGRIFRIIYDSARTGIGNPPGTNYLVDDPSGQHSNHMHVSIFDPDGPNN